MAYNVLIVEDQRMPRQLLEIYVKSSPIFNLSASITSSDTALNVCKTQKIDLILMDVLTALGANGLDASELIKKEFPKIKIIVVTSMPEASWLKRARQIGVDSFWYKECDSESVLSVMERTMAGEHIYPDSAPNVKIGFCDSSEFTEREIDVLRELLTGDSNTEIADRLCVSVDTVKFHVSSLLQKTGFRTRTELATQARSLGIVIK